MRVGGGNGAYLARTSLGQVFDDVDLLGRRKRSDDFADLERELFDERAAMCGVVFEITTRSRVRRETLEKQEVDVRFECDKRVDGLAGEFVCCADHGGLGDAYVHDERRLDFGGRETMAGYVNNICRKDLVEPLKANVGY
jgi:hypothetical protein